MEILLSKMDCKVEKAILDELFSRKQYHPSIMVSESKYSQPDEFGKLLSNGNHWFFLQEIWYKKWSSIYLPVLTLKSRPVIPNLSKVEETPDKKLLKNSILSNRILFLISLSNP